MSPESVDIECPQKVCTFDVPRKCVHWMSPESVYIECPQKVCTFDVPRKCVHLMSPESVYIECSHISCLIIMMKAKIGKSVRMIHSSCLHYGVSDQ